MSQENPDLKKVKSSLSSFARSPMGRKAKNGRDLIALWKLRQRYLGGTKLLADFNADWKAMYSYADAVFDIMQMGREEAKAAQNGMKAAETSYKKKEHLTAQKDPGPSFLREWDAALRSAKSAAKNYKTVVTSGKGEPLTYAVIWEGEPGYDEADFIIP